VFRLSSVALLAHGQTLAATTAAVLGECLGGYIRLFKKMPVSAVGRGTWGVAKSNVRTDIYKRTAAILVQYTGALQYFFFVISIRTIHIFPLICLGRYSCYGGYTVNLVPFGSDRTAVNLLG